MISCSNEYNFLIKKKRDDVLHVEVNLWPVSLYRGQACPWGTRRRRSLRILSWCVWTTCCWRRAWRGQRRAAGRLPPSLRPPARGGCRPTARSSTPTTKASWARFAVSTTLSWRSMSRYRVATGAELWHCPYTLAWTQAALQECNPLAC